jgi:multidrug efflux pump
MVLSAVFLPMAFFGGSVGEIYRQFSITMVAAMTLSVVVAIVLSPALAAVLLKRHDADEAAHRTRFTRALHRLGDRLSGGFEGLSDRYRNGVAWLLKHSIWVMTTYALLAGVLLLLFLRLPTSFLPAEDQGRAQLQYTLPTGATFPRTMEAVRTIEQYFLTQERRDVPIVFLILGQNQAGAGQNTGRGFIALAPWDQREGKGQSAAEITQRASARLAGQLRDAEFFALNPPPVRGLGQSSGFTMELLNTGGLSREAFRAARDKLLADARGDALLDNVRSNALDDNPTLHVDIDQEKVGALGLAQGDVDATLSAAWGGNYVNDFIDRGRVKRVYVQGDAPFRSRPEDLAEWFVRAANGSMAPFSSFATLSWERSPTTLSRYNGWNAYEIQGAAAPGRSSGDAMLRMETLAAAIPGTAVEWSGLSYQERQAGSQTMLLYAISLAVVFLCLAGLYESWSIPVSVLMVVPLGLLGAVLAVTLRGLTNDVYFQVGLLTTMGLAAKNAILIVEFAELAEKQGMGTVQAALHAARLRLRPIVMTSLAFVFGVLPLAISTGAGAQSRIAIGTAVIGGMITGTVLAVLAVPTFFVLIRKVTRRRAT